MPGTDTRAYLLTKQSIFAVTAFIKRCSQCSVRHSYSDWREGLVATNYCQANVLSFAFVLHAGVFNICNKVFITLDVLLGMRSHIRQGEPVTNCAHAVVEAATVSGDTPILSEQEISYIEQKVYDGYFAFEALSDHQWNEAVCGICGVAPVFESGDGNAKNCIPLSKGQVHFVDIVIHMQIC